jgi:hypothetical protein
MPSGRCRSKTRREGGTSFSGTHNRNDLEIGDVLPVRHPLIEQPAIVAFHYLEASLQIPGDPAAPILDPVRHESSLISETPIHGNGIPVPKVLNDHVQHECSTFRRPVSRPLRRITVRLKPDTTSNIAPSGGPDCADLRSMPLRIRKSRVASLPRRLWSMCSRTHGSSLKVRLRLTDQATK